MASPRIESCSEGNKILCSKLPALQHCRLPCATQLPALQHCRPSCATQLPDPEHQQPLSISITASFAYHPDGHRTVSLKREIKLDQVTHLELDGETAYLAEIDLSSFPKLTDLIIKAHVFPLQHLGGKYPITLHRLVISGMKDVSLEPDLRFHRFLQKISFAKLVKLTIHDASLWKIHDAAYLAFSCLETLELLDVEHAKGILQQDFPRVQNVSFSTSRRKEVNDFLTFFVGRHSSHLRKVLIRRQLEKRLLLTGSRPCLTARRYEVLSPQAVNALLACQLRVFALEGRVYFRPEDWDLFCTQNHSFTLTQVYIAPPNPLVQSEVPFKVCTALPLRLLWSLSCSHG
jgi:hypothetical protein